MAKRDTADLDIHRPPNGSTSGFQPLTRWQMILSDRNPVARKGRRPVSTEKRFAKHYKGAISLEPLQPLL